MTWLFNRFTKNLTVASLLWVPFLVGCAGSQTPTIPNPFIMADRVPPPMAQTPAPGTAAPYYSGGAPANTLQPGNFQAAPFPQQPALQQPGAFQQIAPQGQLPSAYPQQQQPTYQAQPFGALQQSNRSNQIASLPGDNVTIPTDSTSLRFAAPQPQLPLTTQVASRNQSATANRWVSGAAPVRTNLAANRGQSNSSLRIRVPGSNTIERQPVSVAALSSPRSNASRNQQVQIRSLPANTSVGWR